LILGPPGSGRTTLGKQVAQKYGLVYISTTELISDQIGNKKEYGDLCLSLFSKGELIPDEIIFKLVKMRIEQTDSRLNGYVLDGFPKSLVQL
jgi:adenylate kinase